MIKNRPLSFAIIIAVYFLAIAGGIFFYNYLSAQKDFSWQLNLLLADVFATVFPTRKAL